ncbi:hydroxyphenylacetyl-CoA thioesterase PaaI [Microbacterium bovistercoris]|uniref:Hydroxyphenylacetyl-CoA thioesterase PaaI n=1 Tax=Microbacterium bovistercoris TaxID=2293570 RepID=A0A371NUK0_9MICO|nr:hydroxyphenylacetyl-CoA thioesterase PaaI [Microbacterium bovistercoris]REJ06062.1 hydroxyphenylacetyl-CoA thioesterase PaaI [Microbacterium bovistercoris]
MVSESDPQRLAEACAARMWQEDAASMALGMSIVSIGPGRATLTMTVRDDMVNGHGICHGGLISSLADSAFAFACNSRGTVTVAAGFEVDFIAPAALGDRLVAEAREIVLRGRSGIYDVVVRNDEAVVAVFRGRSRSLGRPVVEDS